MEWKPHVWWRRLRGWLEPLLRWLPGRGRWSHAQLEAAAPLWGWWHWPGLQRSWRYAVYEPGGLRSGAPAPLVIVLHGCGQQAQGFAQAAGWVAAADRGPFRLLCPQQREGANPHGCWNWFHPAAQAGQGEIDVVLQALAACRQRHATTQVAAVGLSAGGALAALLAFHAREHVHAVVAAAAPPLIGPVSLQDPRQVLRQGLSVSPQLATHRLLHCASLLVLHGGADEVVAPVCGEQLAAQACDVLTRGHGPLSEQAVSHGTQWHAGDALVLRHQVLPGQHHEWTGGPGGHPHVAADGAPMTALAVAFLREVGVLQGR